MTDTIFPDISEHQAKADLAQVRQVTEGIGVRVCYGQRLDLCMPFRRDEVHRNRFKAVLWYLFLRAHQDVAAQVATFTHCIPSLAYGEAAMVDYESDPYDNNAWPTEAQRDQAQRLLDAHYGRRAGTYASGLVAIPQDRVRWIADYEVAKPHTTYDIWQYTDGYYTSGRYAPVDWPTIGKRDTNVFHGTADQLAQLLSPTGDDDVIDPKLFKKVVPCPDQSVAQNGRQARWVLTLDGGVFLRTALRCSGATGTCRRTSAKANVSSWISCQ
jgi:GH25 family lysozyme M1 (1,4-beta-N-acetylmuramidase)